MLELGQECDEARRSFGAGVMAGLQVEDDWPFYWVLQAHLNDMDWNRCMVDKLYEIYHKDHAAVKASM